MKKTSKHPAPAGKTTGTKHLRKEAASAVGPNSDGAVTTPPDPSTTPAAAPSAAATSFGGGWTGRLQCDETRTSEPSPSFRRATGVLQSIRGPQPTDTGSPEVATRAPVASPSATGLGATAPRTTMRVANIIVSEERRRRADTRVVEIIVESVKRRGLLCPIRVRRDGRLVSGLHRLLSHEQLGLEEIEVVVVDDDASEVDVELDELEENLCRRDLSVLERALGERRQKALYLMLHEDTKRGVAGAVARQDPEGLKPKSLSFAAAEARPGSGRRMVEQRNQIAEKLGADAALLLDHPIADDHTKLVQLARVPDGTRKDVVEKLARGEVKTLAEALKPRPPKTEKPKGKAPVPTQFPIVTAADGERLVRAEVRGRRLRIALDRQLATCTVTDEGAVDVVVRPAAPTDDRVLTLQTSLLAVDEVVQELPSDLAPHVTVSPLIIEEDTRCPRCGGSEFRGWRSGPLACIACIGPYHREAYGLFTESERPINAPRIYRELTITSSSGQEFASGMRWWSSPGKKRCPGTVEIYLDGAFLLDVETPSYWTDKVEALKEFIRARLLRRLVAAGHLRDVCGRVYRDDGTEIVLVHVPAAPAPELPAIRWTKVIPREDSHRVVNPQCIAEWVTTVLPRLGLKSRPCRGELLDAVAVEAAAATSLRAADVEFGSALVALSESQSRRPSRDGGAAHERILYAAYVSKVKPVTRAVAEVATYNGLIERYCDQNGLPRVVAAVAPVSTEPESGASDVAQPSSEGGASWYVREKALAGQLLAVLAARAAIGSEGVSVDGDGSWSGSVAVKPVCTRCGAPLREPETAVPNPDEGGPALCFRCYALDEMPYVEADAAPLVDEGIAGNVGGVITTEPESGSGVAAPSYADAAPWYVTERALAGNLLRLLAARVAIGVAGGVGADGDGGASVPVKPVCMWCGTVQFDPEPPRRDHDGSPLCCICFIRSETVPVEPNPAPLVAERTRGTMDESEAGGPEAGVRKRRKTIGDVINEKLREAREGHLASAVATSIPPTPTTQVTTEKAHHAVDTTARSTRISDETYTKVAPRLLRMMMRAGPSGFSSHELATSMRRMKVTSSIVIAVARQLDTVLAVEPTRGRARGALAISVRPGAEDEVRKIERSLTAHARKARAAAAPS